MSSTCFIFFSLELLLLRKWCEATCEKHFGFYKKRKKETFLLFVSVASCRALVESLLVAHPHSLVVERFYLLSFEISKGAFYRLRCKLACFYVRKTTFFFPKRVFGFSFKRPVKFSFPCNSPNFLP